MNTMNTMINLTPHEVTILGGANPVVIPASGAVARVAQSFSDAGTVSGIRVVTATYGPVVGLPAEMGACGYCGALNCEHAMGNETSCGYRDGQPEYPPVYIVSAMVRAALPARMDLLSPAEFERDSAGKIVGCRSLERNRGSR